MHYICRVGEKGGVRYYKNNSPNITFHFFTTVKLICAFVNQSLNSYFLSVFWNINLSQTVSNRIILYVILREFVHVRNWHFTCELKKRCKICEWYGVVTQCINSFKIAIITYNFNDEVKVVPLWSWSNGSWIYNYLRISPLKLWSEFEPRSWRCVLDTTLYDEVCQRLETGRWFSPPTKLRSTQGMGIERY